MASPFGLYEQPQHVNDESRNSDKMNDKMQPKKVLGERVCGLLKKEKMNHGQQTDRTKRTNQRTGRAKEQTNEKTGIFLTSTYVSLECKRTIHFVNNWVKRCSLQSIYHNEYFIHTRTNLRYAVYAASLNQKEFVDQPHFDSVP